MPGDERFVEIQERSRHRLRRWQIILIGLVAVTIVGATQECRVQNDLSHLRRRAVCDRIGEAW